MSRLNRSYSEQRARCLLTTTIAFCLGVSVGALLPFFFPPVDILPSPLPFDRSHPIAEEILSSKTNFATTAKYIPKSPLSPEKENSSLPQPSNSLIFESTNANLLNAVEEKDEKSDVPSVNGIYWSDWVERILPKGFSNEDTSAWRKVVNHSSVISIESGCGRMQNRLITYESGRKGCLRYRQNFDQIQGEIFSFYLSQLLGITNLAPSTLDVIDSNNVKWQSVLDEFKFAQWRDDKLVVLTKYVNNLNPAFIPSRLRDSTRRVHPQDLPSIPKFPNRMNSSESHVFDEIKELAQWSDLIVFDYLTANLDRMVNNLYNLQWNPTMMEAPAHNLAKDPSGLLVFLDNESGLLHGYRLLDKYEHYHRLMLDSLCVFRKSTAEAIERLHSYGNIQPLFKSMLSQLSTSELLPMIPDKSIKVLNQRIDTVYRQIQKCQSLYNRKSNTNRIRRLGD